MNYSCFAVDKDKPHCFALALYLYLHQRVRQHRSHFVISSFTSPASDNPKFLPGKIKPPRFRKVSGGNTTKTA